MSVKDKVRSIWKKLISKGKVIFKDIFKGMKSKPEAVATFIAVLEMIKMNKIAVEQGGEGFGDYTVRKISDDDGFDFDDIEE